MPIFFASECFLLLFELLKNPRGKKMGKGGAGVVWASARGLIRGPSSIGSGSYLAFKLYKLAQGALPLMAPCLFAFWCTAMVTFVGLAPDSTLRFGADTTQRNLAGCVFDFKDSVFVEAAMAYFFSYRQQAGVSLQDVMD